MNLSVMTMHIRRTPRASVVVALLLVMVAAQAMSLLHAEVHFFHDSDELCVAFHNVDKQPALPGTIANVHAHGNHRCAATRMQANLHGLLAIAFQARAPPLRRSQSLS